MMRLGSWGVLGVLALSGSAVAADARVFESADAPAVGDCVLFREGGAGLILTAPVYWLRGTIAGLSRQRRLAGRCPRLDKPLAAYTRTDWLRIAASTPCVDSEAEVAEVDVLRVLVSVDSWETPWSHQHGTAGWLFRGQFLDQKLEKGGVIDMDATWLQRCEVRQ